MTNLPKIFKFLQEKRKDFYIKGCRMKYSMCQYNYMILYLLINVLL